MAAEADRPPQCPEADRRPQSPLLHRIYPGSPIKLRTPKRLFQCSVTENTSVYKARKVVEEEVLSTGEVYITHAKTVNTNSECFLVLAKLGVSEAVLISEALAVLNQEVDNHFQSILNMPEFSRDASEILASVAMKRGYSFLAFAHGIYQACSIEANVAVYAAVQRSGMKLFWQVLMDAAEEHADNETLQWMANCNEESEFDVLHAWSSVFVYIVHRNKVSHPFSFIGGDVQLAEEALEVLKFLIQQEESQVKYGGILHMLKAAVPMLATKISLQKMQVVKEKEEEALMDQFARQRLPKRSR